jgi:uncharacterized protein YbcI
VAQLAPRDDVERDGSAGSARAAISNLMVRLHREYTGRGPVKARTYTSDDLVACVLEDALTPIEQTLASDGQAETVGDVRGALQQAMRRDMVDGVEEISRRRVRAFLSANQVDPNVAVETFLLEPPEQGDGKAVGERNEPIHRGPGTAPAAGRSRRPEPSYRSEPS